MLEFTLKSPKRFLNDIVTLAPPDKNRRVLADRRVAAPTPGLQANAPRKRRRNDGLNHAKQVPLDW
jgi:hypothetical protein